MRVCGIFLLLILSSTTAWGEVPESILGAWKVDMVRTMNEHIDRIAQTYPDLGHVKDYEAARADLVKRAVEMNSQLIVTFSKNTITSASAKMEPVTAPYTVIGGNSRLVVIESTDDDGYETVVNIRLVEGGIAFETTNCRDKPEQCKYERRKAIERSKESGDKYSSTNFDIDDERDIDGVAVEDIYLPKWAYFEPAN